MCISRLNGLSKEMLAHSQEQVNAAFQAESLHLKKVVQSNHDQTKILTLCEDLLKEKNDVAWHHS